MSHKQLPLNVRIHEIRLNQNAKILGSKCLKSDVPKTKHRILIKL